MVLNPRVSTGETSTRRPRPRWGHPHLPGCKVGLWFLQRKRHNQRSLSPGRNTLPVPSNTKTVNGDRRVDLVTVGGTVGFPLCKLEGTTRVSVPTEEVRDEGSRHLWSVYVESSPSVGREPRPPPSTRPLTLDLALQVRDRVRSLRTTPTLHRRTRTLVLVEDSRRGRTDTLSYRSETDRDSFLPRRPQQSGRDSTK